MRCLSVKQPWAQLIVTGVKRIENRVWGCHGTRGMYEPGPLLIHAGLRADPSAPVFECPTQHVPLPLGAIVGVVRLVGITPSRAGAIMLAEETGGVDQGRFADAEDRGPAPTCYWVLRRPVEFVKPIPYRGQLGVFYVEDELTAGVLGRE